MASIINEQNFKSLKIGSKMRDREGKIWTVSVANCGGPGKYPTHFVVDYRNMSHYVFHDGTHMRFLDDENKNHDGAICGAFEESR
jgi:hypothetical protein